MSCYSFNLRLLGREYSGKTTFLNRLQEIDFPVEYSPTIGVLESKFTYKEEDTTIVLYTKDISGDKETLTKNASKLAIDADVLLVFCNIDKYLVDDGYRIETQKLFRASEEYWKKRNKTINVFAVLSYIDLACQRHNKSKDQICELFKQSIKGCLYAQILFFPVNALKKEEVRSAFNSLMSGIIKQSDDKFYESSYDDYPWWRDL